MSHPHEFVTPGDYDRSLIPNTLNESIVLGRRCYQSGLYDRVAKTLRVQRRKGAADMDFVHFLVLMHGAGYTGGLADFHRLVKPYGTPAAAAAGRQCVVSASALSRYLAHVQRTDVREFGRTVFGHPLPAEWRGELVRAAAQDATGRRWNVFDFDHQQITLAQRCLPRGENYPRARRLIERTGEIVREQRTRHYDLGLLSYAGTGLFAGAFVSVSPGVMSVDAPEVAARIRLFCAANGLDEGRTMIRLDGAGGNYGCLRTFCEADLAVLTRATWYQLLDDPRFQRRLAEAAWEPVESTDSGPRREATEGLPVWLCDDSPAVTIAEGAPPPNALALRLAVSRYRGGAAGTPPGHARDGMTYELITGTPTVAGWSAGDMVAWYFGRAGMENQIARVNERLQSERLFSQNLCGQELVLTVGLLVSNLRIAYGWSAAGSPRLVVARERRAGVGSDVRPPDTVAEAAPASHAPDAPEPAAPVPTASEPTAPEPTAPEPTAPEASAPASHAPDAPGPAAPEPAAPASLAPEAPGPTAGSASAHRAETKTADRAPPSTEHWKLRGRKAEILKTLLAAGFTFRHELFSLCAVFGVLFCLNGKKLRFSRFRRRDGRQILVFRAEAGVCDGCEYRPRCMKSTTSGYRREVCIQLGSQAAIGNGQEPSHPRPSPDQPPPPEPWRISTPPLSPRAASPKAAFGAGESLGPYKPTPVALFPADLYHTFKRQMRTIQIRIQAMVKEPAENAGIARAEFLRCGHRRRSSWEERNSCNALPAGSTVAISYAAADPAKLPWLAGLFERDREECGAAERHACPDLTH